MKNILIILILVYSFNGSSNEDVSYFRQVMNSAENDPIQAKYFKVQMENIQINTPIMKAYECISKLIYIKHFEPFWIKFFVFNKETKKLDEIIKKSPHNIEVRFLRYAVQDRAPFFLGYNDDLEKDKLKIENCFSQCEIELKSMIMRYFLRFKKEFNNIISDNINCKCEF